MTEKMQIDTRVEERTVERYGWVQEEVDEKAVYQIGPGCVERRVRLGEEERWVLEREPESKV